MLKLLFWLPLTKNLNKNIIANNINVFHSGGEYLIEKLNGRGSRVPFYISKRLVRAIPGTVVSHRGDKRLVR